MNPYSPETHKRSYLKISKACRTDKLEISNVRVHKKLKLS